MGYTISSVARPNTIVVPRLPGDKVVTVTIRMLASTAKRLRVEAATRELSLSDLVAEALAMRPLDPIYPDSDRDAEVRLGGK